MYMNKAFKFYMSTLIYLGFNLPVNAQNSLLWNSLQPGAYNVGFVAEWKMDYTRTWGQSDLIKEDYVSTKPYGRPVRISTWYPAAPDPGKKQMKMKDYLSILANDPISKKAQSIIMNKDIGDSTRSIKGLFSGDEKQYKEFLNTLSEARINATYVKGKKFPLLVYSLGQNDHTFENIVLFEYLASNGFVVISVPHLGVNARKDYLLLDEPLSFDTQVRDMEFALSQSLQLPYVDNSKIGSFGMSFGTIYSLLLAGRNSNIKALVGLDGTVMGGLEPFAYKYWQSPFYDSCNVKAPILQLFRKEHNDMSVMNSLIYSDRYLLEIKDLTHADFTSYPMYTLHTPRNLLDTFALSKRTPEYASQKFKDICKYVSIFFDATLNNKPELLKKDDVFQNRDTNRNVSMQLLKAVHAPNEEEFSKIILHSGADSAIAYYNHLKKEYPGTTWLRQRKINRIGYEMLYNNKVGEAIKIFKFNVAVFPGSADVYDSLGEGYMVAGKKDQAIANYTKSLEINPKNEDAKKAIESLQSNK